jgi:hypothetical protein
MVSGGESEKNCTVFVVVFGKPSRETIRVFDWFFYGLMIIILGFGKRFIGRLVLPWLLSGWLLGRRGASRLVKQTCT